MEDYNEVKLRRKGFNKVIITIVAAAVLLLGGSVAAFMFFDNGTPKTDYFLYEKNTLDLFADEIESRYSSEIEWSEKSLENPIEDTYELSAEVNMQLSDGSGYITPEQIINNSTITIKSGLDRKEKIATAELQGSFGNFTIDDINFYLTAEKIMVGLPFINEVLQLKGDDLGKILQQVDPTFTGEEKIDFEMLFEGNVLAEEDVEYLKEEYLKMVFEALPEEAFESVDETVKIGDDNVNTEKITFHLTEEQVKDILADVFNKMADDKRLKEIIVDYVQVQGTGPFVFGDNAALGMPNFEEEFDTAIQDAIDSLDDFVMPNGFTSIIWVHDDIIVKRDFSVELGPTKDQVGTLYFTSTLNKDKNNVTFSYDLGVEEDGIDTAITLDGELSNDDGNINDTITLSIDTVKLVYESNEKINDNKKEFERVFSLMDEMMQFDLVWSGNAEYNGDQMNSSHEFTFAGDGIEKDAIVLHLDRDSKVTDSINLPNEDDVKDIGSMSIDELMVYFESEVAPQFEQWLMGIIGFGF